MRGSIFKAALCTIVISCCVFANETGRVRSPRASRTFHFDYTVVVPAIPAGHHRMRIWVPLPPSTHDQNLTHLHVHSPISYQVYSDQKYDNRYAYFEVDPVHVREPFRIEISAEATRYERQVRLPSHLTLTSERFSPRIESYLGPDRLVPIDGVIAKISNQQTEGISDPIRRARALYDYVLRTMHYDHAGTGWGRGDAIWACSSHHGNCTDFHSLFIALARAAGIPARFDIGFAVPTHEHEGPIASYHCWAEFFVQGIGWIPIDAAEASQTHGYFFGDIDDNRIRFTRGRDLILQPAQAGSTLNYFVYPYAELDRKPFPLEKNIHFSDVRTENLPTSRIGQSQARK